MLGGPLHRKGVDATLDAGKELEHSCGAAQSDSPLGDASPLQAAARHELVDAVQLARSMGKHADVGRDVVPDLQIDAANPGVVDERPLSNPPEIQVGVDRRAAQCEAVQ